MLNQPKYRLKTELESDNGTQYISLDIRQNKIFTGALMNNKNVKQEFTEEEIEKIRAKISFQE